MSSLPTYQELIQLLGEVQSVQDSTLSTAELLSIKFSELYPHIPISRPGRFLETVHRIEGPIKNGLLKGATRRSYLKRQWAPRSRNKGAQCKDPALFPAALSNHYGLTIESLCNAFGYSDEATSMWCLHGIPNVEYYRKLHLFLKKWIKTRSLTKNSIGKFYLATDSKLRERGSTPYNTYRFIEQLVSSNIPDLALMSYGTDKKFDYLQAKIQDCHGHVQDLDVKVKEQHAEMSKLKVEFEKTKEDLAHTMDVLSVITNDKEMLEKGKFGLEKKLHRANDMYESTLSDLFCVEDDLMENKPEVVGKVIDGIPISSFEVDGQFINLNFQTKQGSKVYSDHVRQLYYSLLADQIPPAKIRSTIKSVLKCFLTSLNTDDLVLPRERCTGYMRREELKSISMAHKAHTIIESKSLDLNSDGTTKFQKKIGGVAVNGMVFSLNEVPDGSANSMIEDISRELEKLRDIAQALHLPNPERINWTLFTSSTSDSASTQKKFNRLLKHHREEDEERFGLFSSDVIELVENLCAMHLGSNLRKAFLDGTKTILLKSNEIESEASLLQHREYDRSDTFIHEFCKLFGTHGVPEYGCGISFTDYLALKLSEESQSEESKYYYSCTEVLLERQVGSRYFVSASNAAKIFFLAKAALDFLKYTDRHEGNNLERALYQKLQYTEELARIKADAIMYYFVYSELVMLAKSEKLGKSALDMNRHYVELQLFLQMIVDNPEAAMDKNQRVFVSEERLYGFDETVNHRIRSKNVLIYSRLFQPKDWDINLLYPLLAGGAIKMKEKLSNYAKNQLPGGKYWKADPAIQAVLNGLKPNNDICESILGLNDYLTTAIPNMSQMTRSNLVEIKKNGTMKWFQDLPLEQKDAVAQLAVKRRGHVMKHYTEEKNLRSRERQEYMKHSHQKRKVMREKAAKEKDQLFHQHLITNERELREALDEIDACEATSSWKMSKKLTLIRMQINIRKKVLIQKINIPFTHHKKKRPILNIVTELIEFIATHPHATSSVK